MRSPRRRRFVAALALGAALAAGCRSAPSEPTTSVVEVVDGDTIVVDFTGHHETVRLLGIDTPETVAPGRPVECFGPEASERLNALLPAGAEVDVVIGAEARDRYRRLLGYVFRSDDGLFVNAELVSSGAATTLSYEPNTTFEGLFARLEIEAREARAGQWEACP